MEHEEELKIKWELGILRLFGRSHKPRLALNTKTIGVRSFAKRLFFTLMSIRDGDGN